MENDFANGRLGQISFSYQWSPQMLCYIPIEDTNWMMTILIQDNVISNHISSVSSDMMRCGIIQLIIVLVIIVVFLQLIH